MACILVTGGAGFIGSHTVGRLLADGHRVLALDNLDSYYSRDVKKSNLAGAESNENFTFIEGSISDSELTSRLVEEHSVEYVIHEAAQPGVRASMENPLKAFEVNAVGTLRLIEAVGDSIKKFVFASSSSVYGRIEYLPFNENHPTNPISPYGMSKLCAEHYIRLYSEIHGLDYVMLRYFTVYGPGMRPDLAIHIFTVNALKGIPIEIFGDGSKTRDFTFISDAVDGTVKTIEGGHGVYNIGGGSRVSIREVAERILSLTESKSEVVYTQPVKGDVEHTLSDTNKAQKELGWKPKVKFEEGLAETVEWFKQRY